MKLLIMCLTIFGASPVLAENFADVTAAPDAAAAIAAAPSTRECAPFKYPVQLSDAQIYKKTMGNLTDETIFREVRRLSGGNFAISKVSPDVGIGRIVTQEGCKELVNFVNVMGQRSSDNCSEFYEVTVRDQNIPFNVGKFEVKTLISCPRPATQDQAQSIYID